MPPPEPDLPAVPTLSAVAERAGVSAITVSRVVRLPEMVAPQTRARVEAAMRELGYVPNQLAGALAGARALGPLAEMLLARHPEAYADHAAAFFTGVGNQPHRAVELALTNQKLRDTPRSRRLLANAVRRAQQVSQARRIVA